MSDHRPSLGTLARSNPQGFTLVELIVVMIIIGILATIGIMQFLNFRERCHNATLQSDLRSAYTASRQFFLDHPNDAVTEPDLKTHGYRPSRDVEVTIHNGTEAALSISATHPGTPDVFQVDHTGAVTKQ